MPAKNELLAALEPQMQGIWESAHPHIPYNLTVEEALRGSVVKGRFQLHPEDLAKRAGIGKAA